LADASALVAMVQRDIAIALVFIVFISLAILGSLKSQQQGLLVRAQNHTCITGARLPRSGLSQLADTCSACAGGEFQELKRLSGPLLLRQDAPPNSSHCHQQFGSWRDFCPAVLPTNLTPSIGIAFVALPRGHGNFQHFLFDQLHLFWGARWLRDIGVPVEVVFHRAGLSYGEIVKQLVAPIRTEGLTKAGATVMELYLPPCYSHENFLNFRPGAWDPNSRPLHANQQMLLHLQRSYQLLAREPTSRLVQTHKDRQAPVRCAYGFRHPSPRTRTLLNLQDFHEDLETIGYQKWDYKQTPTFRERARWMRNVRHIVFQFGTDLTNLVFLPRGATVHVLTFVNDTVGFGSPRSGEMDFFRNVARLLDVQLVVHAEAIPEPGISDDEQVVLREGKGNLNGYLAPSGEKVAVKYQGIRTRDLIPGRCGNACKLALLRDGKQVGMQWSSSGKPILSVPHGGLLGYTASSRTSLPHSWPFLPHCD